MAYDRQEINERRWFGPSGTCGIREGSGGLFVGWFSGRWEVLETEVRAPAWAHWRFVPGYMVFPGCRRICGTQSEV